MDNPETLGTHDTGQRHWVHMTQDRDKQSKKHNTENGQHGSHQKLRMTQVLMKGKSSCFL